MPALLTRALRLLVLLALFMGGAASHEVAMAGGMHDGHAVVDGHAGLTHHGLDDTCGVTDCEQPGPPCCVMGQCLLGITTAADLHFGIAGLPKPDALLTPGLVASIVLTPFRPPATA